MVEEELENAWCMQVYDMYCNAWDATVDKEVKYNRKLLEVIDMY